VVGPNRKGFGRGWEKEKRRDRRDHRKKKIKEEKLSSGTRIELR